MRVTILAKPLTIITRTACSDCGTVRAAGTSGERSPREDAVVRSDSDSQVPGCTDDTWPLYTTDPLMVDDYQLVSRLGAGGMADVFCALAPAGELVAIKLLHPADGAAAACAREYQLAHAVAAECTAPVLGYGVSTAGAYLVVTYLPGYRCATTLAVGTMATGRLWSLGLALAGVLGSLHARNIVHCDIKPANLLIRRHDVRVIDFGIARHVAERFGDGGIVQCSRGWAAPEQLRTEPATPAVDVFAWGCVLAYLATGIHPFASTSEEEWILRIQSARPDLAGLPPGLDELIPWALGHDPTTRPSAYDLAAICRVALDQDTATPS